MSDQMIRSVVRSSGLASAVIASADGVFSRLAALSTGAAVGVTTTRVATSARRRSALGRRAARPGAGRGSAAAQVDAAVARAGGDHTTAACAAA